MAGLTLAGGVSLGLVQCEVRAQTNASAYFYDIQEYEI